ncbi:unnamed protein product, partial [Effrenium voratum]
ADLRRAGDRVKEFTEETRFFPLQGLGYQLGFVVPIGLTYFGALYGIMQHPDAFRDFATAPSLWLDSLLLPDPLGVLPCLSALALLGNAEVNATPPKPGQEETAKYFQLVIRGALLTFAKSWGRPSSLDMILGLISANQICKPTLASDRERLGTNKVDKQHSWLALGVYPAKHAFGVPLTFS